MFGTALIKYIKYIRRKNMRSDYAPKRIYYRKRRDLREKVNQE